jgi:hypothetical protein
MSFDLFEVGAVGAAVGIVVSFINRITARRTSTPDTDEKRCTGYRFGRGVVSKMHDDCTALRSADCKDGRCTYHCEQMCKCVTAIWGPRE